ncbi:YybH family protein [Tenacibaculum ovolyticum]|uniref:YybH family protein n=1 Tax=Tenacibaculum ovolyticum TaxID=104270 RepID=UPI001F3652EB|nr:DUF4440 domain-containing protein [Tenacibaculum ovolyticum]
MTNKEMTIEEKKVLNTIKDMTKAFHEKKIDNVMNKYVTGAVVVFEPELPIKDTKEMREKFLNAFNLNPLFTYNGHEVFIYGNTATHIAPWTMNGTTPDGTIISQNGLSVSVLKKQPNGDWLIAFDNPHSQYLMM